MLSRRTQSIFSRITTCSCVQRIDLDFDFRHVSGRGPRRPDGGRNAACRDDVIVLDQHGVEQADAVIVAAAAAHGVFLEGSKPGVVFRVSTIFAFVPAIAST